MRRTMGLWLAALGLLAAGASASAAPNSGRVWMMPNRGPDGVHIRELFEHPEQWAQARKQVDVLAVADYSVQSYTDEELRAYFKRMREWRMNFGLEVGAIKPWGTTGQDAFRKERQFWDRCAALGAPFTAVAMDEPLCSARKDLHQPISYAVEQTALFIQAARKAFPKIAIGDIEPYPFMTVQDLEGFVTALQARLAQLHVRGLDFLRIDPDWNTANGYGHPFDFARVKELELFCRARRLPFSLIYWAADFPNAPADDTSTWYRLTMKQGELYRAVGGSPDQFVIESWIDIPPKCLPDDSGFSFTQSVRDFTARFVPVLGRR